MATNTPDLKAVSFQSAVLALFQWRTHTARAIVEMIAPAHPDMLRRSLMAKRFVLEGHPHQIS